MAFLSLASLPPASIVSDITGYIPIVLVVLMVYVFWTLARSMPRQRTKAIRPEQDPSIGWHDIAGIDEAKEELREVVDYLRDPRRFRRLGAHAPSGVLLYGPPGTGKTLLAKAVAHEAGAAFYAQSASSFVEMYAGLGSSRIRRLFKAARRHAPAIIFIDELDAVGMARGNDNREYDQTLNQLLVEMDGFGSTDDVVVIAASNLLERLDQALLRPGRFDRQIYVSPPDVTGRERILEVHTRRTPIGEDVDFAQIARQTSGLTGADLENIVNEAAINAARRSDVRVGAEDFDHALERVIAGMQSRRRFTERERRVIAFHEAGHAVCGASLASLDPVHRISIIPRGRTLGYTLNLPEEDRFLHSREELIDLMTMLLGGRAAEALVFGSVTNGATDDLKRVADIAHAMIYEYAMGTSIVSMRTEGDPAAQLTQRVRDEEVRELADEALRAATALITEHRVQLDALAHALLERETIEREEIEAIMEGAGATRPDRRAGVHLGLAATDPDPAAS